MNDEPPNEPPHWFKRELREFIGFMVSVAPLLAVAAFLFVMLKSC